MIDVSFISQLRLVTSYQYLPLVIVPSSFVWVLRHQSQYCFSIKLVRYRYVG